MRSILALSPLLIAAATGGAQVRVNPTGVNVNAQGATTVFLTFGGLTSFEPAEAFWCGELVPAAPAVGLRCAPGTIFGQLPLRYDRSSASGTNAFTDIMTIPPSVTRRAYQAAEAGSNSAFYYVRRFRSLSGAPDQFVAVTCRMTGGGARAPLSLTDVRLDFQADGSLPVPQIAQGATPPAVRARIAYTGTGRLAGRWEVVLPGDELPTVDDLLTEATLPLERRGTQRRYTQLERFNVFLPPAGRVELPGPDPSRLPTRSDGVYYLLLRIETSSDKEGDSNLGAVGAGEGVVHAGAVAGFPLPVLRYVVGSGQDVASLDARTGVIRLIAPSRDAATDSIPLTWEPVPTAAEYRVEIGSSDGTRVLAALLPNVVAAYRLPPWLAQRVSDGRLRWRVVALDLTGHEVSRSEWRRLTLRPSSGAPHP
jgi:hypothetical protein